MAAALGAGVLIGGFGETVALLALACLSILWLAKRRPETGAAFVGFALALVAMTFAPGTALRGEVLGPRLPILLALAMTIDYSIRFTIAQFAHQWLLFTALFTFAAWVTPHPIPRSVISLMPLMIVLAFLVIMGLVFPSFWVEGTAWQQSGTTSPPARVQSVLQMVWITTIIALGWLTGGMFLATSQGI